MKKNYKKVSLEDYKKWYMKTQHYNENAWIILKKLQKLHEQLEQLDMLRIQPYECIQTFIGYRLDKSVLRDCEDAIQGDFYRAEMLEYMYDEQYTNNDEQDCEKTVLFVTMVERMMDPSFHTYLRNLEKPLDLSQFTRAKKLFTELKKYNIELRQDSKLSEKYIYDDFDDDDETISMENIVKKIRTEQWFREETDYEKIKDYLYRQKQQRKREITKGGISMEAKQDALNRYLRQYGWLSVMDQLDLSGFKIENNKKENTY